MRTADIGGSKVLAATETTRGTVRLATDGENAANSAVQASDTRLSDARAPDGAAGGDLAGTYPNPQIRAGVIMDADINAGADIAGTKMRAATTTARGTVELAENNQNAANLAVQANDDRLSNSRAPNGTAGGDLTGIYPNPTITNNAVTSAKILNGTITNDDIAATASIAAAKIAGGALVGATEFTGMITGRWNNLTISNDVVTTAMIKDGTITNEDIANDADIDGNKIKYATETTTGTVRFATDGQSAASLAVQANDSRLKRVAGNLQNNAVPHWNSATTQLVTGTIFDDGNVGIGTESPQMKLDVNGPINFLANNWIYTAGSRPLIRDSYFGYSGTYRAIQIGNQIGSETGNKQGIALGIDPSVISGGAFNGDEIALPNIVEFMQANPGKTDWMQNVLVLNNGNVGIGTTSPGAKLDVNGSAIIAGNVGIGTPAPAAKLDVNGSAIIAGNVGIGTPSPTAKLDIQGGRLRIGNTMIYDNEINRYMNDNLYIGYRTTANTILQPNAGNVGIGKTPSPAYKLDVNGNANISGPLYLAYSDNRIQADDGPFLAFSSPGGFAGPLTKLVPHLSGFLVRNSADTLLNILVTDDGNLLVRYDISARDILARKVTEYSDTRTKLDQDPLDYGLTQVMALKPKRYNQAEWERDKETGEFIINPEKVTNDIGLVAQEMQEIIPEAVVVPEDENKQPWAIAYSKLIPVLIKAMQEQQAQIEELKKEIQAIKSGM